MQNVAQHVLKVLVISAAILPPLQAAAQSRDGGTTIRRYGATGLARGESARLIVTNLLSPDLHPPSPCRVAFGFVDQAGAPWNTRRGEAVGRTADLVPGQSAAVTLRWQDVFSADASPGLRAAVRAVMQSSGPPDNPPDPCAGLTPTLEIFDALTGWTQVAYPDPGPLSAPLTRMRDEHVQSAFGFIAIGRGLVARLNASRLDSAMPDAEATACQVLLEFRTGTGELWTTRAGAPVRARYELLPGQTASLDLSWTDAFAGSVAAREVIRPVLVAPGAPEVPPNPCACVMGSVEIFDGLEGRIRAVWQAPGPPGIPVAE